MGLCLYIMTLGSQDWPTFLAIVKNWGKNFTKVQNKNAWCEVQIKKQFSVQENVLLRGGLDLLGGVQSLL